MSGIDKVRNEDICKSLGQVAVVDMVKDRQMRWNGGHLPHRRQKPD